MAEYEFSGVDLIDELVSLICPIDAKGPSKQGKYYTIKGGVKHDFESAEEADYYFKKTGCAIWSYLE